MPDQHVHDNRRHMLHLRRRHHRRDQRPGGHRHGHDSARRQGLHRRLVCRRVQLHGRAVSHGGEKHGARHRLHVRASQRRSHAHDLPAGLAGPAGTSRALRPRRPGRGFSGALPAGDGESTDAGVHRGRRELRQGRHLLHHLLRRWRENLRERTHHDR